MGPDEKLQYQYRQRGKIRLLRDGSILVDSYIDSYIPRKGLRKSGFWRTQIMSEEDIRNRQIRRENKRRLKRKEEPIRTKLELTPKKLWGQDIILTEEVPV